MPEIDEVVTIESVLASHGWFGAKEYDVVLTKEEFLLLRVPPKGRRNRFERGMLSRGVRAEDLRDMELREGSIVIPHQTVQKLRLYAPPVQPNFTYYKVGISLAYNASGGKRKKLRIAINGFRYQLERERAKEMPKKMSDCILMRNQFLAEYAIILKRILIDTFPAEVLKESQWDIPELAYEIPTPDLKAGR